MLYENIHYHTSLSYFMNMKKLKIQTLCNILWLAIWTDTLHVTQNYYSYSEDKIFSALSF